jgi:hypothetical protein
VYDPNGDAGSDQLGVIVAVYFCGLLFVFGVVCVATVIMVKQTQKGEGDPDGEPAKLMECE